MTAQLTVFTVLLDLTGHLVLQLEKSLWPSCIISSPRCGPLLIPLTFTCGEPCQELVGLRDTEQVFPGDRLGLGASRGSEPGGQSSPDAFSCLSLRSLAVFFFPETSSLQTSCLVTSYHIRGLRHCTASLLSLLFPSLQHLPSFPSLPFVFVCLSSLGLGFLFCPGLLSLGLGLSPRIVQTPLYLTSVPLGRVLSLSP